MFNRYITGHGSIKDCVNLKWWKSIFISFDNYDKHYWCMHIKFCSFFPLLFIIMGYVFNNLRINLFKLIKPFPISE